MTGSREVKLSSFYKVATSFSVLDIASPVRTVSPDIPYRDIDNYDFLEHRYCIVKDESRTYGYIDLMIHFIDTAPGSDSYGGYASEKATPIDPNFIISSSTSLIELPLLFEENRKFYFILTGNEITHSVNYSDLDSLQAKLCLFALLLELEATALDVLITAGPQSSINRLSEERLGKIRTVLMQKRNSTSEYQDDYDEAKKLLYCTNYYDKKKMLMPIMRKESVGPFKNLKDNDSYLTNVQEVRNRIAHSDSILDILKTPAEFKDFVSETQGFIAELLRIEKLLGYE